jgi:hypothetical protein
MELSFGDRFHQIPKSNAGNIPLKNEESKFELSPNKKKANPNKKNVVKYCLDHEVISGTTMCESCEHKFSCLAYFSSFEIIEIRKFYCYYDNEPKNESQIYESLISYLMKHQVHNYESLPRDKVSLSS